MSQKTFFCMLRSAEDGCEQPSSPTDMEAVYAKYQAWQESFAKNIVDMGAKLGQVGAVVKQDGVSDGPYVELKELVGGYMTIKADSLDEAVAVIKASPMVLNPGVSVEIRELATA